MASRRHGIMRAPLDFPNAPGCGDEAGLEIDSGLGLYRGNRSTTLLVTLNIQSGNVASGVATTSKITRTRHIIGHAISVVKVENEIVICLAVA